MVSRWILIFLVFVVAVMVKNIHFMLELSGSVFANMLVFVIPPILYLKTHQTSWLLKLLNSCVILLGVALAAFGVVNSIRNV